MKQHKEQLRSVEQFSSPGADAAHEVPTLTKERIRSVCEARREMLRALKGDIKTSVYDLLEEKVEQEQLVLLSIIERDSQELEQRREMDKVLRSDYFTLKPLHLTLL